MFLWHSAQTWSPTKVVPAGIRVGRHLLVESFCSEMADEGIKTIPQISKYKRQTAQLKALFLPRGFIVTLISFVALVV